MRSSPADEIYVLGGGEVAAFVLLERDRASLGRPDTTCPDFLLGG